jgi:zinc protease
MKIKSAILILLLLCSTVCIAQTNYKQLKFPPLHTIQIPNVKRVVLKNGMILYLVEDHELPVINMTARIGVGGIDDPPDKIGLASVATAVMRTGGTESKTGDQIDEQLEGIAASVETGIRLLSGTASLSVLKENIDIALPILADILMHPAFPPDKIQLQKIREHSAIARRNDEVQGIAYREFYKLIYGPDSVYARQPEHSTIEAITRDDLVAFHKKYYYPNNMMLGVWGDFKTDDMVKKINRTFSGWKMGAARKPVAPPVNYNFDYQVNLIRKEDVNQSTVLMGHIGGLLNNPDYFALEVMNNVLSGSFSSRLFRNLRSKQGLAYSVFGDYGANFNFPGVFLAGAMTKSESTVKATQGLLDQLQKMKTQPVTDEELGLAKDLFLNSFVFNFEDRADTLLRLMAYEYYGYPRDFLEKMKANIEKVTKEDVMRVAKKYIQPDKVRILVVGRPEDFDQPLSTLGKVREIPLESQAQPAAANSTKQQ